jgi:hypothetical protein
MMPETCTKFHFKRTSADGDIKLEGGNTGPRQSRWHLRPSSLTPSGGSRIGSTLSLLSFLHYDKHSNKGGWCCFQQQHARHLPIPLRQCQCSSTATRRVGIYYYYHFYDIATTRRRRRGGSTSITTLQPLVDGDEEIDVRRILRSDIATTRRRRRGVDGDEDGDEEDQH